MAILGAVLGDIIGAQYEFNRPKNLDWKNVPLLGEYGVGFTDDSVMALAIKKALDEGLDLVETMVDVGRRYPFCGYGGNFYHRFPLYFSHVWPSKCKWMLQRHL